ncbi:hypothetical protein Tco_0036974 [Tanacetum coccineum]
MRGRYAIRGRGLMMGGVRNRIREKWRWMLGEDGEFMVKELARLAVDKILLVESGRKESLWNNLAPKEVVICHLCIGHHTKLLEFRGEKARESFYTFSVFMKERKKRKEVEERITNDQH